MRKLLNRIEESVGNVDTSLYTVVRKFGYAGGPDEYVLTDKGRLKVLMQIGLRDLKALEAMESLSNRVVSVETLKGNRITLTPEGKKFGHMYTMLGGRVGYVELIPGDPYKEIGRSYRLTQKGKAALRDFYDEEEYLLSRIKKEHEEKR